ncbi:ribonuclease H [Paenibacillus sp. IHBB 10380]|uniref:ribonuclease H n=1 Tax=Paenibacillus sp. IHBB 10380 TaxID=1566358 RepID=UPI0005CFBF50|nr:ribonuclease H family protein [Paenibacillus sp. IHBB 10380]AJS60948.1 ribonuclease H [Paenibacillus sp. IHBB 10380]
MAKQKYYVVWVGNKPGVYSTWAACQEHTAKFKDAKYKSYSSQGEAEQAYKDGWKKHWGIKQPDTKQKQPTSKKSSTSVEEEIDYNSISVDVGTRGNPGPIEYRGVNTQTGEVIFSHGPISKGTNNLGEFLAVVHSLAYLKKEGSLKTVYSDSRTALKWVREKHVATTLERDESTQEVWELVDRALNWLDTNSYGNKVLKWQTQEWGEIKADYGRK